MKKIEIIWRQILENAQKQDAFQQQTLAKKLSFSTSTVFAAIKPLRAIGALEVTGRNFKIIDLEKMLFFWATHRHLEKDVVFQTFTPLSINEIEGLADNQAIYGAYSAAKFLLNDVPADYEKVYLYHPNPARLASRFPKNNQKPVNLFVLKSDLFLSGFGKTTPPSQTFVDLWNLRDWYAQEFLKSLKEKFYKNLLA